MLAVDPAVLKPWLIRHLEPITDADPATLAEYALALIQRDETPQELERICIENLNDFLESNTEKFVKEMLAFARNPQPPQSSAPPATQRKRTNAPQPMDHDSSNQQQRQQGSSNSNGGTGLAKGMCRDYHMRGFCARGQSCPYQHDAFATAQPPQPPPGVQPFSPFQFPFGPGGPQGPFPPGMRPGIPFPMGFPGQAVGGGGGMPFGQPGFPGNAPFGGPPQPQNYNGKNGGQRNQPFNPHQQYQHHQQQQQQSTPQNPQSYPPPFPDQNQPHFPPPPHHQQQQRQPSDYPYRPQPSRRPPPSSSPYSRPQSYQRPNSTSVASTPKPPPELTALSEKLATNAAQQKELLHKFESVNAEEKKGIMSELRSLNGEAEGIMIEKKKVEAEFELEKAKGGSTEGGGEKGDLKAHLEKLRSEAASLGILPGQSASPASNGFKSRPYPPAKRQYLPPRTAQSFKLDNRSTNILLSFPEGENENVEVGEDGLREYFGTFGEVKEVRVEREKREVFIGFVNRANAEKAMSSGPPPLAPSSKLRWAPATSTQQAPTTPSTLATSNGTLKGEEADMKMEEGEVDSHSQSQSLEQPRSVERARRDEDDDDERSWNR